MWLWAKESYSWCFVGRAIRPGGAKLSVFPKSPGLALGHRGIEVLRGDDRATGGRGRLQEDVTRSPGKFGHPAIAGCQAQLSTLPGGSVRSFVFVFVAHQLHLPRVEGG